MVDEPVDPIQVMLSLKREEIDFLAAVVKRNYQCVRQHPPRSLKTGRRIEPQKKLYIASFSFRLPDPVENTTEFRIRGGGRTALGRDRYQLVVFNPQDRTLPALELPRIVNDFMADCQVVEKNPHFAVMNELSLAYEKRHLLDDQWQTLARDRGLYLVPGTYHCTDEYFGVAPIYSPEKEFGELALKQNCASRQGEQIRTPDVRELFTYKTDYGNVVIWVCLDLYDPGLVLKFLSVTNRFSGTREDRGTPDREISLVLIPAYSKDREGNIDACIRDLSRFSKTAIVCANSYPENSSDYRMESFGYLGGERLPVVIQKTYKDESGTFEVCKAWLYELNMGALQEIQAKNFSDSVFSNPFAAIVHGGGYLVRPLAD